MEDFSVVTDKIYTYAVTLTSDFNWPIPLRFTNINEITCEFATGYTSNPPECVDSSTKF